jgi:hypothetical protein
VLAGLCPDPLKTLKCIAAVDVDDEVMKLDGSDASKDVERRAALVTVCFTSRQAGLADVGSVSRGIILWRGLTIVPMAHRKEPGMSRMRVLVPLGLALLVAGGCGDDDDVTGPGNGSDSGVGTFQATVSGAHSANLSGSAVVGRAQHPETGESAFVIQLSSGAQGTERVITIAWVGTGTPPGTGTHQLVNVLESDDLTGKWFGMYVHSQADVTGWFGSTSGNLSITQLTDQRTRGSFTFAAQGFTATGQPTQISLTGNFDAAGGTVWVPGGM